MRAFLKAWGQPEAPAAGSGTMGSMDHGNMSGGAMPSGSRMPMSGMGMMSDQQMQQLEQAQGADFDRMFLQMMIEHHTGASEMAKTELVQGQNAEAKARPEDRRRPAGRDQYYAEPVDPRLTSSRGAGASPSPRQARAPISPPRLPTARAPESATPAPEAIPLAQPAILRGRSSVVQGNEHLPSAIWVLPLRSQPSRARTASWSVGA